MKTYKEYPKAPGTKKKDLRPNTYYQSWLAPYKLVIRIKRGNKDKVVHFGSKAHEDYTQHKDKERRKNYFKRSAGIRNKKGELTKDDIFSANYHARKVLW